jgi:hypothetical protein
MMVTKRLREPVRRGEITCSVRIWRRPHVKIGGRYRLGDGFVEASSIREIALVSRLRNSSYPWLSLSFDHPGEGRDPFWAMGTGLRRCDAPVGLRHRQTF